VGQVLVTQAAHLRVVRAAQDCPERLVKARNYHQQRLGYVRGLAHSEVAGVVDLGRGAQNCELNASPEFCSLETRIGAATSTRRSYAR